MSDAPDLLRGSVWGCPFGSEGELKPVIVVSSDVRNVTSFPWVHVVRVTTRVKLPLPTIVELSASDPVQGRAMCDEVEPVDRDDVHVTPTWHGQLMSRASMVEIDAALRRVFDLA